MGRTQVNRILCSVGATLAMASLAASLNGAEPLEPPCFGWSIATHGDLVLIGAPFQDDSLGRAYLFRRQGERHELVQVIKRPLALGRTRFGETVALNESALVVGEPLASAAFRDSAGAVYVYPMSKPGEPAEEPQRLVGKSPESDGGFGGALALVGPLLAVGEDGREDGGRVTLLRRGKQDWQSVKQFSAEQLDDKTRSIAWFGQGLAMNETTLVVGAPFSIINDVQRLGIAFVYQADAAGEFNAPPRALTWPNQRAYDQFGGPVVLHSDFIAVSAMLADIDGKEDAGAVCIFARGQNGQFAEQPTYVLTADEPAEREGFGIKMALLGRRLLIGTSESAEGEPGVYVFEPANQELTQWTQVTRLTGSDPQAGFGSRSLATAGSLLYVGEPFAYPRSGHNGQVAVIACDEANGKLSFRRVETIKLPAEQ